MTTELTFVERTTLLVLMAESRPLKLTELRTLGSELSAKSREKLLGAELIGVEKVGRGIVVDLTDTGWARGSQEFGAPTPSQASRSGGKTLYTLLRAMRRYFDRVGIEPNEVFLPATAGTTQKHASIDPESLVRNSYRHLASEPRAWVSLTRLRGALPTLDRSALDAALTSLYRAQEINLIPEANQATLTEDDRTAALHIGGQSRHMMKIDR
ncbi:hypothetical protein [Rhodococcus sp. H29-C3]|uniref:hypothetical protein n=1 Tax=Rhodococcus sp. H29-C3 TaxID=3046307 RepID=UPI0024BBC3C9|nr:hypothetical protein [Rhodococcus sp. H29-C3]MDJ0361808.1 hypothetical protein [Rhodococcus sp. H29-C3]